jgi:hypothetical protein
MEGYLGEFLVHLPDSEFSDYTSIDWAIYFIEMYGQIDGEHHKAWVLDQVARILMETPVIVNEARWTGGEKEYRVRVDWPSNEYIEWAKEMRGSPETVEYSYDEGTPP